MQVQPLASRGAGTATVPRMYLMRMYDWRIKRSGAAMRVYGTAVKDGQIVRDFKLSNVGDITIAGGTIQAVDRDTGRIVAELSTTSNPRF